MLSLYFHSKAAGSRGSETFPDVPTTAGNDVTITITEHEDGSYALTPFPFATNGMEVSFSGRWLEPIDNDVDGPSAFRATTVSQQTVVLVTG